MSILLSEGASILVGCIECKRKTNHSILKAVNKNGHDSDADIAWESAYQTVKCLGCDTISFRSASTNSEGWTQVGEDEYELRVDEELYPNRDVGRPPMSDSHLLPEDLQRIYRETIKALNAEQPVLCGIGVRAIIETITKEKAAPGRDLSQCIDGLVQLGVLTRDGADILHKLRILGNNAAHEVKAHNGRELTLAIDVVEHVMTAVYLLPEKARNTFR